MKTGKFRTIFVLVLSTVMLMYISSICLFENTQTSTFNTSAIPASINSGEISVNNESAVETVKNEIVADNNTGSVVNAETQSQAVAASSEAKGKIINKTISPYSAGLSYNNIYIKNSTGLSVDIKSLLNQNLKYKIDIGSSPQVLIMHTHTTESFMTEQRDFYTSSDQARRTDENLNMVALGNIVADKLNAAGINTIHDKTMHDYPQYNGSYNRAATTINSYLKKYPSIKIVLDMHRDAISSGSDKVKVTTDINGKKAAQVMLVMGSQSGSVTNFPDWQENLKLAVRFQQTLEVMYPTLARPLSLTSKNYNESLTNGSMLLEMGTDANTIEEVKYSAELVGNALVSLLNTIK